FQAAQEGTELPLVTNLGGTRVFVNGIAAPLFFTSYGQINFQIPFEIRPGEATVVVLRDGQVGNTITAQVVERAARILILRVGETDYGIATLPDGAVAWPPALGGRAARPGEALVLWAIGLGQSQPGVASGVGAPGAEPLARIVPPPTVFFGAGLTGGVPAPPIFVGMSPGFVGLFQINVIIPANAPRGLIPVRIEGPGILSNTVYILVQ
ncbi:MAG: hypothetical protein GY953_35455, partial [bacterium]|nr:hypothetical protein [bacterium]